MNASVQQVLRSPAICEIAVAIWATMTSRSLAEPTDAQGAAKNLARGAKYVLSPPPSYSHCTDPGDATQLTDGQLTEGYFWTQKGTVGWSHAQYATITVDLGKTEPIGGASFRTAAGVAGVTWPAAIRIQVSDDGSTYYDAGELLELDGSLNSLPSAYAVRRFSTSKLKAHGRYVRFLVLPSGPYIFVDEVEVLRGPDSLLNSESGEKVPAEAGEYYLRYRTEAGIARRFKFDTEGVWQAIQSSSLDPAAKERLLAQVIKIREDLSKSVKVESVNSFRAILPFNEYHEALFRIQAALWKASGRPTLSAWAVCPWDPMDLHAMSPAAETTGIEVHTMRGEYRSGAFNLANATDKPISVSIRFSDVPGSPTPGYVTVHEVLWTDTTSGQPVASALPEAERAGDGWRVTVPAGLMRQVWMTFHVTDVPAGDHAGSVLVKWDGGETTVPLRLRVYPLQFPTRTTLWVGGWSYTDGDGSRGVTPSNKRPLVKHLVSRFVNAPWATAAVMTGFKIKADEPPTFELDTARMDDWLAQWPDARTYLVFLSVGDSFAGAKMGTDGFKTRVGAWMTAWVRHLGAKSISPDRLGLLLVDEPRAHEQDDVIIAWAGAIRAAEPRVLIWEDPIYAKPQEGRAEMYAICDILCPNRPMWLKGGNEFAAFYLDQQRQGRTLQLYSCSGPARLLDPYSYYRLQAWHCRQIGATGSFFWAFGDTAGAPCWNEYASTVGPYTPVYLDEKAVVAGKAMEAIRESVEDYEYFVMLRAATDRARAAGVDQLLLVKAETLLQQAATDVLDAQGAGNLTWHSPKDRTRADAERIRFLEVMTDLANR